MVNFIILIISHLLGDFYLQTAKIAKCKNAKINFDCNGCKKCKRNNKLNFRYMFMHILMYSVPFVVLFFMTNWISALISIFIILLSHGIIDSLSCFFNKKAKQTLIFIIDQSLHISILYFIYKKLNFNSLFEEYSLAIKTIFIVLILMVPCSIFINKLFEDLYPETKNKGIFDIGSFIGILERFLTIIFAYFENFAAIAIIITVKTWARTNDLKEPEFRNKYLLGTLASLVLALCSYILFKIIL